jgi:hypothetical protein
MADIIAALAGACHRRTEHEDRFLARNDDFAGKEAACSPL